MADDLELSSFVNKLYQLKHDGLTANLHISCEAGQSRVTLQVNLPASPQLHPHYHPRHHPYYGDLYRRRHQEDHHHQHFHPKKAGPSKTRRHARRALTRNLTRQSAEKADHEPAEQEDEFLNPPQDIQPNDGAVEAPPHPTKPSAVEAPSPKPSADEADRCPHQSLAAVEADSPPNDNQAQVPVVAPRPPPKAAAKAAEFLIAAHPLKALHVSNPRPELDELPLLPLPTLSWPGHYLPDDLHSPSMAPDLNHVKTGNFPRDGDGGEASTQGGHIQHQAVGPDELPPSQEHTPQPLELSWIWKPEVKTKRSGRKKKGRS